jgi:hypothetical protein
MTSRERARPEKARHPSSRLRSRLVKKTRS